MSLMIDLPNPEATRELGQRLAGLLTPGLVVYLSGPLGAGKTSLCSAIIKTLGHRGPVKSPTYTLVEPYLLSLGNVYHFDLYRLTDPEELEWIGVRDYFDGTGLCLIEWPERGAGCLPTPDLTLELHPTHGGRSLRATPGSESGRAVLQRLRATG